MKETVKKSNNQIKVESSSFTGGNITKFAGINKIAKIFKCKKIDKDLNDLFETKKQNAKNQVYYKS